MGATGVAGKKDTAVSEAIRKGHLSDPKHFVFDRVADRPAEQSPHHSVDVSSLESILVDSQKLESE
jgi:hypothetical protein